MRQIDKKNADNTHPHLRKKEKKKDVKLFTKKQMENFAGFFNALKAVHSRLIKEGYKIEDGKIIPPKKALKSP